MKAKTKKTSTKTAAKKPSKKSVKKVTAKKKAAPKRAKAKPVAKKKTAPKTKPKKAIKKMTAGPAKTVAPPSPRKARVFNSKARVVEVLKPQEKCGTPSGSAHLADHLTPPEPQVTVPVEPTPASPPVATVPRKRTIYDLGTFRVAVLRANQEQNVPQSRVAVFFQNLPSIIRRQDTKPADKDFSVIVKTRGPMTEKDYTDIANGLGELNIPALNIQTLDNRKGLIVTGANR